MNLKIVFEKADFLSVRFFDISIKEIMLIELEKVKDKFNKELNSLVLTLKDNLPLITNKEIILLIKKAIKINKNIVLKYKKLKVGKIDINSKEDEEYSSNNFEPFSSLVKYEKVLNKLNKKIIDKHIKNGVIVMSKKDTYISPEVTIGKNTIIKPGVFLLGKTIIGENNTIGPYSSLENFICGCYNKISWFVSKDSKVGDNNTLGPFTHFRENVTIENGNVIGNFNELKSVSLGSNNRMKHLSYFGNVDGGNQINVGCGVISANYDGKNKHKTIIEDDVFIGCNSVLVAPIELKRKSFVAAQSIINKNLNEYDFAIGRAQQVIKQQYMKK